MNSWRIWAVFSGALAWVTPLCFAGDPLADIASPLIDIAIDALPGYTISATEGLLYDSASVAKGGLDVFYDAVTQSPNVGVSDPTGVAKGYCLKMFSAIERHELWIEDIQLISDPFTAKAGIANALNGAAFLVRYNSLNELIHNESVPRESRMMYAFALAQESYGFMSGRIEALSPVLMGFTFVPNAICQLMLGEAANAMQSTHQALDIYDSILENRYFSKGQPDWFKARMGLQALYVEEEGYGIYQPLWRQLVADYLIYTNTPYVVRYEDSSAFLGMKYRHSGFILKSGDTLPEAKSIAVYFAPLYLYSKDFQGGIGQSSFDVDVTYRIIGANGGAATLGVQRVSSVYPGIVNSFDPSASEIILPSYLFGESASLEALLDFKIPANFFSPQRGPTGTVIRIPLDASITGDATPPTFSWSQARLVSALSFGNLLELSCDAQDPESSIDSIEVQVKTAAGVWTNLDSRHYGKRVYINPLAAPATNEVRGRSRSLVGTFSDWRIYKWVEGTPLVDPASGAATGTQQVLSPPNGASNVATQLTLTWADTGGESYDLYLGSSPGGMNLVAAGLQSASFATNLTPSSTYFWQIVTHQAGTSVTGAVWAFTTGQQGTSGTGIQPEIISRRSGGTQTQADSRDAGLSRDGRYVIFACDDLTADSAYTNTAKQVYIRDRILGNYAAIERRD